MHSSSYRKMLGSPVFWALEAALAALGAHLCLRGAWATGAALCALAASLVPPLGGPLFSAIMWRAVHAHSFLFKPSSTDTAYWVAVARDGGDVIGCVCVRRAHTLAREAERGVAEAQGEASVWRLSVAPAARKLGVGRALMAQAEAYARARGCTHMSLITGNLASRAFYLAIGYAPEALPRAATVLYGGATSTPASLLGRLKGLALQHRLQSTVLAKPL